MLQDTLLDGRGPSTTSQERQEPRHEHPKPNQERLGLREERLGQRGGASSSRWKASRPMKGASRTKLLKSMAKRIHADLFMLHEGPLGVAQY